LHQKAQENEMHGAIREADKGYTPLNINTKLRNHGRKDNQMEAEELL